MSILGKPKKNQEEQLMTAFTTSSTSSDVDISKQSSCFIPSYAVCSPLGALQDMRRNLNNASFNMGANPQVATWRTAGPKKREIGGELFLRKLQQYLQQHK